MHKTAKDTELLFSDLFIFLNHLFSQKLFTICFIAWIDPVEIALLFYH